MRPQILVPLDGSFFGQQALPLAMDLARRAQARLHLVKVHVQPSLPVKGDMYGFRVAEADQTERNQEISWLQRLAADLRTTEGLAIEAAVLAGPVASALEAYVRDHQISLVVMTTHGRGGLSRAWFGSVADALVRNVSVPVLMYRPKEGHELRAKGPSFGHILIPLDGSALAEQAIVQALEVGALFDARYTLVQVVGPVFGLAVDTVGVPLELSPDGSELLRREARQYLERLAVGLRERGYRVDTAVVIQAQAAPGILEEASYREADLIVMCSHGRGGVQRFALGSVADKVLRGASMPVMMFRAAANVPELYPAPVGELFA
jgi:nucleotide-binding universal stress UspA family protein